MIPVHIDICAIIEGPTSSSLIPCLPNVTSQHSPVRIMTSFRPVNASIVDQALTVEG